MKKKRIQDEAWLCGKGYILRIVQRIKISPHWQMVFSQIRLCLRKWGVWDFEIQTDHQISATRQELVLIYKKRRSCQLVDLAVTKITGKNKRNRKDRQYLALFNELKKLWNIKVIMKPIVGALVPDGLEKKTISGETNCRSSCLKTISTTALLKSTWILKRVLETCCHSDFCEKPSIRVGVKNLLQITIIIIISSCFVFTSMFWLAILSEYC